MAPMAQWSLLVLATFILGAFAAPVIDDPVAFKKATFDKCQKKENVPDAAMNDFFLFKSADGIKDHKCVTMCITEEYGSYQKGGKLNKDIIHDDIKGLWKDPGTQSKLITKADECIDAANYDLDPCEMNYNLVVCFIQSIQKDGLKVD